MESVLVRIVLAFLILACSTKPPKETKSLEPSVKSQNPQTKLTKQKLSSPDSLGMSAVGDSSLRAGKDSTDKSGLQRRIIKKKVIKKRRKKKKYNPAPLVCNANPGTMKGNGNRGEYQLDGTVTCTYEQLVFNTSKAIWNSRRNTVKFFGGMKVQTNGLILTSELGGYEKDKSQIWARKNAKVVDTSDTYNFSADYLSYEIEKRLLNLKNKANLQKIFRDTVYQKKKRHKLSKRKRRIEKDTLEIRAKTILYNDSLRWAKAQGGVTVLRGDLRVTCGNAYYSEDKESIDFLENPLATFKHNLMKGDTMKLKLRGEEFESMSFKSQAKGDFYENEDSTTAREEYHVFGDSIFMYMEQEALQYIEIFRKSRATYLLRKYPEQINEMTGRYLKLDFNEDRIDSASIFGKAKSTYFIYDKDEFKGRNQADGDTIALSFDEGKVNNIFIRGRATGSFFGEEGPVFTAKDSLNFKKE